MSGHDDVWGGEEHGQGEDDGEGEEGDEAEPVHDHGGVLPLAGHPRLPVVAPDLACDDGDLPEDCAQLALQGRGGGGLGGAGAHHLQGPGGRGAQGEPGGQLETVQTRMLGLAPGVGEAARQEVLLGVQEGGGGAEEAGGAQEAGGGAEEAGGGAEEAGGGPRLVAPVQLPHSLAEQDGLGGEGPPGPLHPGQGRSDRT